MKRKFFSTLMTVVLTLTLVVFAAPAPVSAATIDLAVNDENPWTDGAFTFEDISPGGDPMAFDFKLHNVGDEPGILTFSMSISENDMTGAPAPDISANEFASLIYVEAVHYQFKWPADPEKQPEGYIGAVKDDLDSWLAMDLNADGKVSLYEICVVGTIPYSAEDDPLDPTAEITYFIEFQLGDSLEPFLAGGDILTGVEDNAHQGDGISVTIIATLGTDTEESSGNVFQAAGPVLNDTTGVTYGTIQLAIDDASPGDTISVADGTYTENIVVDESLTIQAASTPIIDGDGALGPGVHITATDVTFQGFTITNFTCTPTAGIGAMLVEGDGAVIDTNIIYDITTTGDPINDPAGIGIDVHASNVEVTNNIVHDVGSIGIRVRHDWDTPPTVSNNVLLEKNEVYRTANSGVLVTGYAKGVTLRENEIYESLEPTPYNLFVHYASEDVLIENNIIRDPYNSAVGYNVVLAGCDNVTISGNAITGATSGKNIYILSDYGVWVDAELLSTNTNIINNDIQNGKWGVRITKTLATGDVSQMAATTTINFNNISGHTEYGVENTIATDVDAQYNWWGDVAGPDTVTKTTLHNPYEEWTHGDNVSDYVDYLPWLIQIDLVEGWNIWSDPIILDEACLAQLDAALTEEVVTVAYYFDSSTQDWWNIPEDASRLDAWYIKMKTPVTVNIWASSEATFPSQKEMKVGWNFVGLAELYERPVNEALSDALYGTGETELVGYNKVISPSLNGVSWTYLRGGGDGIPDMYPTKGYWVFMVNDGVLGGFTETPIIEVP